MQTPGDEFIDLKNVLLFLWRWLWWVALCAVVAGLIGVAFSKAQATTETRTDMVEATLLPYEEPEHVLVTNQGPGAFYASALIRTSVLEAVLDRLDLPLEVAELSRHIESEFVEDDSEVVIQIRGLPLQHMVAIANEIPLVFEQQEAAGQEERLALVLQSLQQQQNALQGMIQDATTRLRTAQDETEEQRLLNLLQGYLSRFHQLGSIAYEAEQYIILSSDIRLEPLDNLARRYLESALHRPRIELVSVQPVTIVERVAPATPLSRYVFVAVLTGVLLAFASGFIIDLFDDTLRDATQIERVTSLPLLGTVTIAPEATTSAQMVVPATTSPDAEVYRLLLLKIGFSVLDCPFQTLLVTSSSEQEGTNTAAVHLAVTLARMGKQVLLVDMRLHQPGLHSFFEQPNERGVSTLLAPANDHDTTVPDLLCSTSINNLWLLPAGTPPPNASEQVGSRQMVDLIETLKHQVDIVILTAPPLLHTADTLLLARLCDAALLLVQLASTQATNLKRASDHLLQSGVQIPGILVTRR